MQPASVTARCTDYNFLIAPRYAPRFTPLRDPRLRCTPCGGKHLDHLTGGRVFLLPWA